MKGGERPGSRDGRPALRPRERILAVAIRLFLEEGIGAVGVHRIVDEAGVALMTLYRHFGGKDGVVVAALEQWSAGSVGWLADEVDRCGDDPEARFAGLWAALERRLSVEDVGRWSWSPPSSTGGCLGARPGRRSPSIGWRCGSYWRTW